MKIKTLFLSLVTLCAVSLSYAQSKQIDVKKSSIEWTGKKVTGQHNGDIQFKSGLLKFSKGGILIGGYFEVDMNTINTLDLQGEHKQKLDGHLKADDFFGVDKFPVAKISFRKIKLLENGNYEITANLKIKNTTKPVKFILDMSEKDTATTSFKIDRTKYGIKYGSGSFFDDLGDKTIDDEFEVKVNLAY
ncbi:MAG: YceI family protein [Flavobacteriales bacterium]|nr:YceI family protein [Flavobacteriales bacterium]